MYILDNFMLDKLMKYTQFMTIIRYIFLRIIGIFVILFAVLYYNSDQIMLSFLNALSLNNIMNVNFYLTDSFVSFICLSLYISFFIVVIYVYFEIYFFIYDALLAQELRVFNQIMALSMSMYICSIVLVYYYIAPLVVKIFLFDQQYIRIISLIDSIFMLVCMFNIVFQLPVVLWGFIRLELISVKSLRVFRRYFIVLSFIIAAIVTPPDICSQFLLAIILIILYELMILLIGKD